MGQWVGENGEHPSKVNTTCVHVHATFTQQTYLFCSLANSLRGSCLGYSLAPKCRKLPFEKCQIIHKLWLIGFVPVGRQQLEILIIQFWPQFDTVCKCFERCVSHAIHTEDGSGFCCTTHFGGTALGACSKLLCLVAKKGKTM